MKRLRYIVIGIVIVVLLGGVVSGVGFWFTRSETAAAWLMRQIESRSGGRLAIGRVSGTLAQAVVLEDVSVRTEAGSVRVDRLTAELDFAGFLARALVFERLSIGELVYEATEEDDGDGGAAGVDLPVLVLVREFTLDRAGVEISGRRVALGGTSASARYVDGRLTVEQFRTDIDGFAVDGSGDLVLDNRAAEIDVDACASGTYAGESLELCVVVDGNLPVLQVSAELLMPFAAKADGSLRLGDVPELELEITWADAALAAYPEFVTRDARLRVSGPLDRLLAEGGGTVIYRGTELGVFGRIVTDGSRIGVQESLITVGSGELRFSGELNVDTMRAELEIAGEDLDPGNVFESWSGNIDIRGRLSASIAAEPRVELTDATLRGALRDYPVLATGALTYMPGSLQLHDVVIVSRADRLEVAGSLGPALDVEVVADLSDLGLLWPGLGGDLNAQFTVRGARAEPQFRGEALMRGLSYGDYAVEYVSLTGNAGARAEDELSASIRAQGISRGTFRNESLTARLTGTIAQHAVSVSLVDERWELEASGRGGLLDGQWLGSMDTMAVDVASLGLWRLSEASAIEVGRGGFAVSPSCLSWEKSQLCFEASLTGEPSDRLSVTAAQFDVQTLSPLFPEGFSASGIYEFSLSLIDLRERPRGFLSFQGSDGGLRYVMSEQDQIAYTIDRVSFEAGLADSRLTINGDVESTGAGSASLTLSVEDVENPDSPVDGTLDLVWVDTSILSLASPDIGEVGGLVAVDIALAGSLGAPSASGDARWTDGFIEVPDWNLEIRDIAAEMISAAEGEIGFSATGTVDGSRVELTGSTRLDPEGGWPTEIRLHGDELRVAQLQEVEIIVSPDLVVQARMPDIAVTGTVEVPRARLAVSDLPEQAITPSTDAVVHGRDEPEEIRPLSVSAQIQLTLGEDVRYVDTNLDASLSGELAVDYRSGQIATAVGSISVSGNYNAYGQPLALERGQLIFAGPWNDPTMDVRAIRVVDQTTVGIQLSGSLQQPVSRLFSDPAMSEADALTYLLLGRPLETMDSNDRDNLQSAALSMGLRQAIPGIERVGQTLGLDELGLRTTESGMGALMAGKYLSPRLYVRYSYGLFNRIGGLLLRYRINDKVSLETESGEQHSMHILYTVERD